MLNHAKECAIRSRYHLSARGVRLFKREMVRVVALFALFFAVLAGMWFVLLELNQSMTFYTAFRSAVNTEEEVSPDELGSSLKLEIARAQEDFKKDLVSTYLASCLEGSLQPTSADMQSLLASAQQARNDMGELWETWTDQWGTESIAYDLARVTLRAALEQDAGLLDRVAPEAALALADDLESAVVYSWADDSNPFVTYNAYGDGHVVRTDSTLYELLGWMLRIGTVIAIMGGPVLIIATSLRRPLVRYDALYEMVRAVVDGRDQLPDLPDDVTEDRAMVEDVRKQQEQRERAAREAEGRKNELVAYLAHDIKTPLTSVIGYLSLLDEAPDMPAQQRERYISSALNKAYRLDEMMDGFFDITRFNIGSLELERSRFDLATFCEQLADEFQPEAARRAIQIAVSAPEETDIFADAEKLFRAMGNIIRNALAYADPNSVVQVIAQVDSTADSAAEHESCGNCSIAVVDHGKEISPAHLERIFEKFYREGSARSASTGGAGLGLAIAREIARAHGGDITARSENGVTTFTLTIPQRG